MQGPPGDTAQGGTQCSVGVTPWTAPYQASLSVGFPRQEYWSGLPCRPPGNVPDPEIELGTPVLQADSFTD